MRDTKDNIIVSVREFPTCNYVILVSTPLLCQHPVFKPPVSVYGWLCGQVCAAGVRPFLRSAAHWLTPTNPRAPSLPPTRLAS